MSKRNKRSKRPSERPERRQIGPPTPETDHSEGGCRRLQMLAQEHRHIIAAWRQHRDGVPDPVIVLGRLTEPPIRQILVAQEGEVWVRQMEARAAREQPDVACVCLLSKQLYQHWLQHWMDPSVLATHGDYAPPGQVMVVAVGWGGMRFSSLKRTDLDGTTPPLEGGQRWLPSTN